ncbi:phage late control D family protein [Campylobacter jejuni]|uniref:phage late control D family protein n=1 Tax=Campylobacter jejuni TaxID=197 RepID=UPI00073E08E6|nr:phage tail protein [Campylobacter jejuni]ALW05762.1 phage tail protein [Campylobacter jejuni]ALW07386.1 phage tail protein [Campylobacter jejuni]ALW10461.1 phage tail protein [Campylobacter jejuni]ALW20182.1 phage tail protein [Campylobacter jejuni]ALW21661.1 phage tail protein [Campylobacter jejuni]
MVNHPSFKIKANDKDITQKISLNLINLSFDDKAKDESDEISISLNGLYARAPFGDKLELWLGFDEKLFKCGTFSINSFSKNYSSKTTDIKATAINFASNIKNKKSRTWENTNLADIALKIAGENNLKAKTNNANKAYIKHELQNNVSDIEFIYTLCAKYGFLACIKEQTLIIIEQKEAAQEGGIKYTLDISELSDLNISIKNRNDYTGVKLTYQDIEQGIVKSVLSGNDKGCVYELKVAGVKNDSEALNLANAKLNALNKGSFEGSFSMIGKNIKAGANLEIKGIDEKVIFSIKDVKHDFSLSGYTISVNFEG